MKNHLLLLHGALGSSIQFHSLISHLESFFSVAAINFRGHGGERIPDEPFSIDSFADDVLFWLDKNNIQKIDIFGYSMGGFVGLYLALHHPERIANVVTLATKFDWNEESSEREAALLNPEKMLKKIPAFAEELKKRHAPQDWKIIVLKTAEMMMHLGIDHPLTADRLKHIQHHALILVGDQDTMVSVDETREACSHLKNGTFMLLPETKHPLEKVNTGLLVTAIHKFLVQ